MKVVESAPQVNARNLLHRDVKPTVAGVRNERPVLFISREFPPSLEMGARSCAQIAGYLHLYGWTPVVLTARDKEIDESYRERDSSFNKSFVGSIVQARTLPHALDLYRWFKRVRLPDRAGEVMTTVMADSPVRDKHRVSRLVLSLLAVPDMSTGWMLPAIAAGCTAVRRTGARMIFSSAPSWTNHLVAYAVAALTGLPWVAHLRDPWATGAIELDLAHKVADRIQNVLERRVVTRADAVICVTEEHTALMRLSYSDTSGTTFVTVPNGFDPEEWHHLETMSREHGEKFVITYAGKIYMNRSPKAIFRALRTLIAEGEVTREELQIDFIGWCDVSERRNVADIASEFELSEVINLTGPLGRAETLQRMTQSDLLLLLAEGLVVQIPGKTYEYLKAGRPILALTPEGGAVANLLKRTGGGWALEPGDDVGIVAAMREALHAWRRGAPAQIADTAFVNSFDRRALAGKIAAVLDRYSRK